MAVLPHSLDHHQRRSRRYLAKNFHAALLAVDKTVLFHRIERMPAPHFAPFAPDRFHHRFFSASLRRPALLIGGKPQITICDQNDGVRHGHILTPLFRSVYRRPQLCEWNHFRSVDSLIAGHKGNSWTRLVLHDQLAVIVIIYSKPVLHFKFFRVTIDLSNGRRLYSPARPFRNPCKHYYYSGHRIRPRLRPLGTVFRGHQRGKRNRLMAFFVMWVLV